VHVRGQQARQRLNELGRLPERDDVVTLVLPRLLDDDGTVDKLVLTVRSVDHRVPGTVEVRRTEVGS
jgi:hypothetical protein